MSKLLVCGSRNIHGVDFTKHLLPICDSYEVDTIITGGAKGVDEEVEKWANRWMYKVKIVRPDYAKYGKFAPIHRDKQMADECDACVAFWNGISRGTKATIGFIDELMKPCVVFMCKENGEIIDIR